MREIWKFSNNKPTWVVEYRVAYCKQISLVFCRFSPYINNFTSKSKKTVFVNTARRVLKFSLCRDSRFVDYYNCWNKENHWFALIDSFWRSYVVMHLRLQITETSSFCSFNIIIGFSEMLCWISLRVIDKELVKLRPKKGLRSPALAKIALEILYIFGRNFRNNQNYKIVQNLLHMLDYCIIIYNSQINNWSYARRLA